MGKPEDKDAIKKFIGSTLDYLKPTKEYDFEKNLEKIKRKLNHKYYKLEFPKDWKWDYDHDEYIQIIIYFIKTYEEENKKSYCFNDFENPSESVEWFYRQMKAIHEHNTSLDFLAFRRDNPLFFIKKSLNEVFIDRNDNPTFKKLLNRIIAFYYLYFLIYGDKDSSDPYNFRGEVKLNDKRINKEVFFEKIENVIKEPLFKNTSEYRSERAKQLIFAINSNIQIKEYSQSAYEKLNENRKIPDTEKYTPNGLYLSFLENTHDGTSILDAAFFAYEATKEVDKKISLLKACISMEILLGEKKDKENPKGIDYADRYAFFLGKDSLERKELRDKVLEIYKVRNNIMHGNLDNDKNFIENSKLTISHKQSIKVINEILIESIYRIFKNESVLIK